MSALADPDAPRISAARSLRLPMAIRAARDERAARREDSPTTTTPRMLLTVAIALVLGLLVNARAIVRDSAELPDGPAQTITRGIGLRALAIADLADLTWPRDRLDALLGNAPQPAVPPLLAAFPSATPAPPTATIPPSPTQVHLASSRPTLTRPTNTVLVTPTASATRTPTERPTALAVHTMAAARPPAPPTASPTARLHSAGRAQGGPAISTVPAAPRNQLRDHRLAETLLRTPPVSVPRRHPVARHPAGQHRRSGALPAHPLRRLSAAHPLRLLVTGDSLTGYLGPILVDRAAAAGPVVGAVDTHNGTGLTRPDYVDWSMVARRQIASDRPDVVVVMMGGNDFQNMTLPNGQFFQAGTPAWTHEYARRAAICMRIWAQGGTRRVYWLSMVPARDPTWAADDAQINVALRAAAAQVPGAEYLDILGPVTDHGRYADFVNEHGQPTLIREPDGVHLNYAGSAIVAGEVLPVIEAAWDFGR